MNSLFKKSLKFYFLTLVIILVAAISSYTYFSNNNRVNLIKDYQNNATSLFKEGLKQKFSMVEAIAINLANIDSFQQALADEDRDYIHQQLIRLTSTLTEQTIYKRYSFHFITFDGRSLYRSYAPERYGQDLTQHPLVSKALKTEKPVQELVIGGYSASYRLIHMQPAKIENEVIGYVSVSQDLKSFVDYMAEYDYEYGFFKLYTTEGQEPVFAVDQNNDLQSNQMKKLSFKPSEIKGRSFIELADRLVFISPLLIDNHPIALHAISLDRNTFEDRLWEHNQQLITTIALIAILILLSAAVFLFQIRVFVSHPIEKLTATIDQIIKTKDYSKRAVISSNDEIGRLGEFFNHLLTNTEIIVNDLNQHKDIINDALIVSKTNPYGTITYVNDRFCEVSGYSKEALIGKPHNIVRHPEMPSSFFENIWQTIQAKKTWSGEIRNLKKDGTDYYVMSHIIPILNKDGEIVEFMSVREDITLMVKLREELENSMIREKTERITAQHANKAKGEFLSSMSHELRTPLHSIIGFGQLLEVSELNDKQQKQVQNIIHSGTHLLALINDILEFSKIDSGKLSLNLEEVRLTSIINEVLAIIHSQAERSDITIELGEQTQDYILHTDKLRLKQVILNLISNAIKYNREHGSVSIHFHPVTNNQGEKILHICVSDTGVGISKENMKDLFQPFNRFGFETSSIEGTGIGLTITKALIKEMQGQIEVESVEGKGSTFKVKLPLIEEVEQDQSSQAVPPPSQQEAPLPEEKTSFVRVLYVEDNPSNVELIQDIVDSVGNIQLEIATSAELGLEKAVAFKPQVVLLDINLPDLNGDEALPYFKALPQLRKVNTRYFALSANVMAHQVQEGLAAGFERYLKKPIDVNLVTDFFSEITCEFQNRE